MSHLIPYNNTSNSVATPSAWTAQGRAMRGIVSRAELEVANLAAEAHVENAKIDAIDHVTQRALQGAVIVAQMEGQLAEAVPAAAFRLAQIGQAHTLAMVSEVHSLPRKFR